MKNYCEGFVMVMVSLLFFIVASATSNGQSDEKGHPKLVGHPPKNEFELANFYFCQSIKQPLDGDQLHSRFTDTKELYLNGAFGGLEIIVFGFSGDSWLGFRLSITPEWEKGSVKVEFHEIKEPEHSKLKEIDDAWSHMIQGVKDFSRDRKTDPTDELDAPKTGAYERKFGVPKLVAKEQSYVFKDEDKQGKKLKDLLILLPEKVSGK